MRAPALTIPRLLLALAALGGVAGAQGVPQGGKGPQVLPPGAVKPGLPGLPTLPPLTASSPRNTMLYADRVQVTPSPSAVQAVGTADSGELVDHVLWPSVTGTGKPEFIQYLIPSSYTPGTPIPMLVAWHGFGASCGSVSAATTLDEECEARGWAYLSVTGLDDSLFSTSLVNQHVAIAIAWMSTQAEIDPTRLYGVGFSAGAGCISNFAARHRDPAGPVFAALGLVSGSYDYTKIWWADPAMQSTLQHEFNFGTTPNLAPFAYQRASSLYFTPGSYPPHPGVLQELKSMAQNLGGTPTWITWDTGDTLTYLPTQSAALGSLLTSLGGVASMHPVSGTVDGEGDPAPHSWAVLDAHALCDFFEPLAADLQPDAVRALVDEERRVSWMTIAPSSASGFAAVQGEATGDQDFALHDVQGTARVYLEPDAAPPWGVELEVGAGQTGWEVAFSGTATPAGWAEDAPGQGTTNFEFEPDGDGLLLPVTEDDSLSVEAHAWDAELTLLPDPAPLGDLAELRVDAASGTPFCWVVISTDAVPLTFGGSHVLLVVPTAPYLLLTLPLDGAGNLELKTLVPQDPALSGAWLLLQAVLPGAGAPAGTTNPIRFDID